MKNDDVLVIGGGIVGLATAYHLSQTYPKKTILVLEKERQVGQHQTGHNSGVIHSGIYYKPGSLKAANCREGKRDLEQLCLKQDIPFLKCGKVIVATDPSELDRLQSLYERGLANGVDCEMIEKERLHDLEPFCAGIKAILVRETGIINYRQVCEKLAQLLEKKGHRVLTGVKVTSLREQAASVIVNSPDREFAARFVVNCAGLYSDHITALSGRDSAVRIIPFRGEYFMVKPDMAKVCNTLIYPVPDPRFPFLGVHFTRMISGHVECGPNAVLAFAREGYRKSDVNLRELLRTLTFPGFVKMSARFWQTGLGEMWRSISKPAFVKALQRLVPDIRSEHLEPAEAGVRAQAVNRDGVLLDDFAFFETARIVNVINAPSPAATASLSIGKTVVEKLAKRFY